MVRFPFRLGQPMTLKLVSLLCILLSAWCYANPVHATLIDEQKYQAGGYQIAIRQIQWNGEFKTELLITRGSHILLRRYAHRFYIFRPGPDGFNQFDNSDQESLHN